MNSKQIVRFNPKLTTNAKLIVDSSYTLYMDCIKSNISLNDDKFKALVVDPNSTYGKVLALYWRGTPNDLSYSIKDDSDAGIVYDDFDNQIDDIYLSGVKYNQVNSVEDFEYETSLYVGEKIPDVFVIFKTNGMGLTDISSSNFIMDIVDNMKVVKQFNIGSGTIGRFLNNSFITDDNPRSSIDISFKSDDYLKWKGIDLETGEYVSKSKFIYDKVRRDNSFYDIDTLLVDGFKYNNVIHSRLLNISYLFNDIEGGEDNLFTINRYSGYYANKNLAVKINTIIDYKLIDNINIDSDNYFYDLTTKVRVNPFVDYVSGKQYFIEYKGVFYIVKETDLGFKVISDYNLNNDIVNVNKLTVSIVNNYIISDNIFLDNSLFNSKSVWCINLGEQVYRLKYDSVKSLYFIDTNYVINSVSDGISIIQGEVDMSIKYRSDESPMTFDIYNLDFIDVVDYNYDFIDSEYTDYEYEYTDDITLSDEPKTYFDDDIDISSIYYYNNNLVNIPCGSEYTSNGEIFQLTTDVSKNTQVLNSLWKKNQFISKFGYLGSVSNNDLPYRLNLSSKFDAFNRTTDIYYTDISRMNRNLDYFYTFGLDNSNSYKNFSLNVLIDDFDIEEYITSNDDYFKKVFNSKIEFSDGFSYKEKSSYVLKGDSVISNHALHRGIKYSIYKLDDANGDLYNLKPTNNFNDWKLSVVLGKMNKDVENSFQTLVNNMTWRNIYRWKSGVGNNIGDLVFFDGKNFNTNDNVEEVFICINNIESEWYKFPNNSLNYTRVSTSQYSDNTNFNNPLNTFYNRNKSYVKNNIVVYRGEYYICISDVASNDVSLNPDNTSYWSKIPLYSLKNNYEYYVLDGEVYNNGVRIFTLKYDSNLVYASNGNNEVIIIDGIYYVADTNTTNSRLDSGYRWNRYYNRRCI